LEVFVLRFVRIALLITVSFVAGAAISGCADDTTNTNDNDMAVPVVHDLAVQD
jgi:hypothetical protein